MQQRIYLFFFLFLVAEVVFAQPSKILLLDTSKVSVNPGAYVAFLEDKEAQLTFEQVISPSFSSRFTPSDKENINFGTSTSAFWLRWQVKNPHPQLNDWLFEIGYPILDYVDFYVQDETGAWKVRKMGDKYPFHSREILHRNLLIPLSLPDTATRTCYLRIHTQGVVVAPMEIIRSRDFHQQNAQTEIVYGLFYGIVLIMLLYNFVIFIFLRDVSYFWYIIALGGCSLFLFSVNGHGFQYLWPYSPWWSNKAPVFMLGIGLIGCSMLSKSFLNLGHFAPGMSKWFNGMIVIGLISMAGILILPYNLMVRLSVFSVMANSILMMTAGVICGRRGSPAAVYFTVAWLFYLVGSFLTALRNGGVLPSNFVIDHAADIGLVAQTVLLSLGLSDKYRRIEQEGRRIQAEALRFQLEANEQLEKKVTERTAEINQQKEEIEAQRDNLEQINSELSVKNAEINQQKEEIETQRDNLEQINAELASKKAEIENAYQLIEQTNRHITDSIRYAQTIQQAILPDERSMCDLLAQHFVIYKPKDIVSGDFYWCTRLNGKTFIAVVDCTGHGVPGAFMSMIGNTLLSEIVNHLQIEEPAEILEKLNAEVQTALKQKEQSNDDGMDICLCSMEWLPDGHCRVVFSGAKRPLFFVRAGASKLEHVKGSRKSIGGKQRRDAPFESHELLFAPGAMLYLLSDGIGDQNDSNNKRFGDPLAMLIETIAHLPPEVQKVRILEALAAHQQQMKQRDDITAVGIRI